MIRNCPIAVLLGALPILVSGMAHAACLPTLGTDDCFRASDPRVQAIEHRYLDPPPRKSAKRHLRAKRPPRSPPPKTS
jgi:hypothetical protein